MALPVGAPWAAQLGEEPLGALPVEAPLEETVVAPGAALPEEEPREGLLEVSVDLLEDQPEEPLEAPPEEVLGEAPLEDHPAEEAWEGLREVNLEEDRPGASGVPGLGEGVPGEVRPLQEGAQPEGLLVVVLLEGQV